MFQVESFKVFAVTVSSTYRVVPTRLNYLTHLHHLFNFLASSLRKVALRRNAGIF